MPISVACQCGQQFQAKEALAGKRVKCPKCGNALSIPMLEATDGLEGLSDDPLGSSPAGSSLLAPRSGGNEPFPASGSSQLPAPTANPSAWAQSPAAHPKASTAKTGSGQQGAAGKQCPACASSRIRKLNREEMMKYYGGIKFVHTPPRECRSCGYTWEPPPNSAGRWAMVGFSIAGLILSIFCIVISFVMATETEEFRIGSPAHILTVGLMLVMAGGCVRALVKYRKSA